MKKILLGLSAVAFMASCKGNFKPADNDESAVPETPPATDVQFKGGRRLAVSGRAMAQAGSVAGSQLPLAGVNVLAVVNGVTYKVASGEDGNFAVRDVPMRPSIDGDDTADLPTVVLYIDKAGWYFDNDGNPANGFQNTKEIRVDAHQEDATGNFHVDLGPIVLNQDSLKVTSSVIKPAAALAGRWLASGEAVGEIAGDADEVYMRETDTSITLTFNMPVDTSYNADFVELFRPDGTSHPFTGLWDATGTMYTITPSAMSASNNDQLRWQLRIARPVRAFDAGIATRHELENVSIQFQYLKSIRDTLLIAQTPALYPQADNGAGGPFSLYYFDRGAVLKARYVTSSSVVDVVDSAQTNFCIQWTQNSSASSYKIFARNSTQEFGRWFDSTALWVTTKTGDGKMNACGTLFGTALSGGDGTFTGGESLQLIVAPVDSDGNEAAISTVASPLTIGDNWGPQITAAAYSKTALNGQLDQFLSTAPTGKLTLTFSEALDPFSAVSNTGITALSGLINGVSLSNVRMTSTTVAEGTIGFTMKTLDTTLSYAAKATDTAIYPASLVGIRKGYKLKVMNTANGTSEDVTISEVKTLDGSVKVSAGLTNPYPAGSIVRLLQGESGLTKFIATVSANTPKESTTLAVSNGALFIAGQSVKVVSIDEDGAVTSGALTISSISSNTLNFSSSIGVDVSLGSYVIDNAVTVAEPLPRAASAAFTPSAPLQWNGIVANTTLAIDNYAIAPDAQATKILVNSVTGLNVDDVVVVGATDVNNALTTAAASADTSLTMTGHSYKVGDTIRVMPSSYSVAMTTRIQAAGVSVTVASAVTLGDNEQVTLQDPAFETSLTAAAASGATTITVADPSGLSVGQSLVVDSGVEAAETKAISAISGSTITIAALTNSHGTGARVTRALVTETAQVNGAVSNSNVVGLDAITNNYSLKALMIRTRAYIDKTLTAVAANTVTFAGGIGQILPVGTPVRLVTFPETRRITAVTGKILTLSSGLAYSHRSGGSVTKPATAKMQIPTASMGGFMIGDQIVCDTMAAVTNAHADRFEATIVAFDTETGDTTVTSTRTGYTTTSGLSCVEMGDAVKISGVQDWNGQPVRSTWGNKTDLGAAGTPR